jgi:lipopolysaccharide/colanic/teichoic acid biosynthesis glycosyltransferase
MVVDGRTHNTIEDGVDFPGRVDPTLRVDDGVRRALDVIAAMTFMLMLSPLLAIIATVIKLHVPGPLLCRRTCPGGRDRNIEVFQLRILASGRGATWFRRWLNGTGVQGIPQLINVLQGEMSIVGRHGVPRWSF